MSLRAPRGSRTALHLGAPTLVAAALVGAAHAASVNAVPRLPPVTGLAIEVRTEPQLQDAIAHARSDSTIVIAPGTYRLTRSLYVRGLPNVTIRGAGTDRDAVVLIGKGMANAQYGDVPYGIWAGDGSDHLLVANLTLREFYFHPVIFNAGAPSPHLYNVHLIDAGQQFLKSNPDGSGKGNDAGVVEYSVFEFSSTGRDDYPKAIDIHGARGWIIRNNLFRNIRAPRRLLNGPAVLAWRGSRDTIVEGNTFIDCQREIVMGAEDGVPDSHAGGVVRNNFIYRSGAAIGDAAISVWGSPGTRVVHNTILLSGTYAHAVDVRFKNATGVDVTNNLADGDVVLRNGAQAAVVGHVSTARAEDFVAPAAGDLHLKPGAARAGVATTAAATDWDGEPRPSRDPDVGADQIRRPSR